MPIKNYTSGNPKTKSDFYVEFTPTISGGIKMDIQSNSKILHGSKLEHTSNQTLADLGIKHGKLLIVDNGGQYFTLQARIESTIKLANPKLTLKFIFFYKHLLVLEMKADIRIEQFRVLFSGSVKVVPT